MRKLLIFALFGFLFSTSAVAQVGNGGAPIADVETQFFCYDNGSGPITITKATWYVAGQDEPVLSLWHDTQGNEINPLAEQLYPGICVGDAAVDSTATMSADSVDYEYIVTINCDTNSNGETFYSVGQIATTPSGVVTLTEFGTFDASWNDYDVLNVNPEPGPCNEIVYAAAGVTRTMHNSPSQVLGQFLGYEICNVGMSVGFVTVGSSTTELKPGECWECSAILDETDNTFIMCPNFTFNPSGTEFILTTSTAP